MGNSSSVPLRPRFRRRDNLHRSTDPDSIPPAELQYLKPNGLYPTCQWDPKLVRRLILRKELAPRHPGIDDPTENVREECPICMLVYPVLNETRCCQARLCTECYLQIRPPRHNKQPCPFCKYKRVDASYKGPRDKNDIEREELDQKRAAEAIKRATRAAAALSNNNTNTQSNSTTTTTTPVDSSSASSTTSSPESQTAPATNPYTLPHRVCDCPTPDSSTSSPICPQHDDYRSRYYHDKAPAIDPLLLEAMASEVTYASPPGSAADRASASSSGRLDLHIRDLRPDVTSDSDPESLSLLAEVGHRVVRLPWHGVDVDRAALVRPVSSPSDPIAQSTDGHTSEEDMQPEEKVSLHEAIRRSLIEM